LHELSIAQNIVDAALEEADKAGAEKVLSIEIKVGELMQVEVDVLREALGLLMKGKRLEGASVKLDLVRASFSCSKCGETWGMEEARRQLAGVPDELRVREPDSVELPLHFLPQLYPAFLRCPRCGSSDVSVTAGEDIWLRRVELQ